LKDAPGLGTIKSDVDVVQPAENNGNNPAKKHNIRIRAINM